MSKKNQLKKKQISKNRFMQLSVVIILAAFIAYFVLSNLLLTKAPVNPELESAVKGKTAYSFTKEGELSFTNKDGESITSIDIEIADDHQQRATGLMFRDNMEEAQGMLFIFDAEEPQAFWMLNTILSLDIIYVNSKMEIVSIVKNTKPFDNTSLPSIKPAKYVVEVIAGYCDKFGIKEGDKIVWRRS
ncbi:MAG: hypothetical protein FD143_2497 [Ignavibacteria bacterium]|nr:MAG: hypothetical protein FD143_2497 [Ignavibacteria bacterium]KAF0156691.1 MAG: hypothetical protein FD188_2901 [Ignavibacteria bacterium]